MHMLTIGARAPSALRDVASQTRSPAMPGEISVHLGLASPSGRLRPGRRMAVRAGSEGVPEKFRCRSEAHGQSVDLVYDLTPGRCEPDRAPSVCLL